MKAKDWLKRMKSGRNRRFSSIGCSVISMLVCVAILVTSNAFVFPSIALAGAADEAANAEASANGVQAENRRNDAVTQSADASAEDQLNERLNTLVSSVSLMKQDSAAAAKAKKTAEVASTGAGEYAARLTDRSNDIGVKSEGYEDSPYNFEKTYSGGLVIGYNLWVPDTDKRTGGTVYIGNSATGRPLKLWQAEQYWDGEAPFRITSVDSDQRTYDFQTYNDFTLEDDVAPNGAFKLDHLDLEFSIVSLSSKQNIYARGNKLVIGESVTTKSGGQWRIYGGTEHAHLNDTDGRPLIDTNVVVASGNWDYVFGGGEGPTGRGTQVTIRGNANVTNVYGGGERKGSIGLTDYNERNTLQTNGNGINVYVEDGTVGNIWGGSAINSNQYSLLGLAANIPLPIYEDISINVSGGQIGRIVAASDASDGVTLNYSHFNESNIHGDAIINITGGSVSKAVGDPNRNTPNTATDHRMVLGATRMNISVLDNKLVRAGDAENGVMQMHVAMNGFGFEWDRDETKCTADFKITKYTGTAADPTPVSANITLAMLSALQAGDSGNFRNVTFGTQDGITYLQSFDYIIDNSTPVDPTYYEVSADYHVIRTDDNYEDWRDVDAKNAARCVYDFAGNDDLHSKDGYSDSVMDTIPYAAAPAGADNALLRVYLPYGVTGKLNIAENDGSFQFTDNSTASLESSTTVTSSYGTAAEAYANSHFGVTIGGNELAGGISDVAISNAVSTYLCTVYSYKNVSISDITKNTADGLQLNLSLADLTKDGNGVGTSDPAAVNNGELQIRVTGTFKITYRFTTRTQGERDYVYTGKMSDVLNENGVGSDGLLTDVFVAAHAPYESNHGKTFTWLTDSITKASADGVLTALVLSSQTDKVVHVNYCTTSGGMSQAFEAPIGANRLNNTDVAQINASGDNFRYWEIRKSSSASAPVIAKCYDAEFSFCMMDDYWITPVFDTDTGKTVKLDPEALQNGDEKWLAWTWNDDTDGVQITPSADLTFTGLKDNVIFARINKDYNDLGTGWSNVWNKTYNLEVVDGATYTLMSWGDYYETGKSYMNGTWSGITLTFLDYTRNRWTDSEGAASPNGRSDYLYSDFEIAYSDELKDIYGSDTGYTTGVVFEYCRALYDEETFNPAADYDSGIAIDRNALKLAITNNSSSYAANENLTRRIQRTAIPTATLTNKNRIEFGKSYYNTLANSKAIMKVTAYLIDSSGNVTLSNPVFVCLKETSQRDLAIPAGN